MVYARLDADMKARVELIFAKNGLTDSDAITLFYNMVDRMGNMEFIREEPALPSDFVPILDAATAAAVTEAKLLLNDPDQPRFTNMADLWRALGI